MNQQTIDFQTAESNLLAAATYLAENIKSSDGHAEVMKEIVARYVEMSEVDIAAQLADSVEDPFVRDKLLIDVAEKCAALGDDEYALQLADAIEDDNFQSVARERIVFQNAERGEFEKAFQLAETLSHSSETLAGIAVQQVLKGNEEAALQTISKIEFHTSKVNALQLIAVHFQSKGETEKADAALLKATDEAQQIEFTEEKIRALLSVALHYTENKQSDKAIEVLAAARSTAETLAGVHREDLFSAISLGFLQAGSIDLADRTLDLIADKTQIAATLAAFSAEFNAQNNRAEALETLEEGYAILKSQRDREVRDSRLRFGIFGVIAINFAKFEKAERAIEIALENPDEAERHKALTQIARICILNAKDETARQAINAIGEESAQIFALIVSSDAAQNLEKNEQSVNFLNEAYALCETVPQLALRSEALNGIATRFYNYGEGQKSRAALLESLQTISRIRDESHRIIALSNLAKIYEDLGFELNQAEKEILRTILRRS